MKTPALETPRHTFVKNMMQRAKSAVPQRAPALALVIAAFSVLGTVQAAERPQQLASPDQVPEGLAKSDWSSIRAAYEAGRHAFQPAEGGWQARNPGQQWLTRFDGRGFIAEPKSGDWKWGLELKSYGFAGHEQPISGKPVVKAARQRLTYAWDDTVQEWFVNDQHGLEHGFTLSKRPAEIIAPHTGLLSFTLGIRGDLHPQITTDAQGVQFRDAQGATVLTYAGLKVWDADGEVLPSQFEAAEAGVRLLVDERDARYPITIDPIAQQAYLKAGNAGANDYFGTSVAISGNTAVIGAHGEDSSTTTVNSTPNESAETAGAAYVFVRNGTSWTQQAYLKASNAGPGDIFGSSVAISGDTIVVGAHAEDSSTTSVNSTPNENAPNAGAAYVFVRNGINWTQQAYLKAGNAGVGDYFGEKVAISGDNIAVGAQGEDSSTIGVPNEGSTNSGATYVFVRNGTSWTQQAYLKASNPGAFDNFGAAVALSGDTLVVGADAEPSSTVGVDPVPDEALSGAGAAYVFVRSGISWNQQAFLKASNPGYGDRFGRSVAIAGDTVAIGAPYEDTSTAGVDVTPNDSLSNTGAVYVFTRTGILWSHQAFIKAGNTGNGDSFGNSVCLDGDTLAVGAPYEDSSSASVDSSPNESAADAGAAYLFTRNGTDWTQTAYLKAGNSGAGDSFGNAIAVAGDAVIVGAPAEDGSTTTVNSTPNESAPSAGAAYVFSGLPSGPATFTTTGSTSGNRLWNRPEHNDALPPFALSASATAVPYEAVSFTVNTTGAYTLKSTGTDPAGWDNYLFLYSAAFDPSAPLSNVLIGNDDNPGVGEAAFAYHLNAGTTYFLITTGYGNNHFGDYSIEITGPGAVTVLNSFAEQRLIGGTGLPTGIHQRTPYNATLPNVTFLDTGSSGQPIVGCAPLALARNTFWHSGLSPLSNLSGFQSLINTLHSQGNAYGMISYHNPHLTTLSDLEMKRLSWLRGNIVHNDRRLLSPGDESEERSRVSDIYRWVKSMIDRGYPVLVASGVTKKSAHAFIIDGYRKVNPWFGNEDLYFHFLWGFPPSVSNPDTVSDASWMKIDESPGYGFFKIDLFDPIDPTVSEQFGDWAATEAAELVLFAVSPPPSPSKTFRCGPRFDFEFVTSNITMPVAGYGTADDPFLSFGSPAFWQDKDRLDFIAKPASFNDGDVAQIGDMIFSNSDTDEDDTARIDATLNVHATFGDGLVSVTPMPLKIKPGTGAGTQIIDGPDVSLIQTVSINGKSYHFKVWLGTATSVTPEVSVAQGTSKTTAVWAQLLEATQKAQIISPANGSTLTSTELPLEWNAGLGVTRYDLYVGTTVGGKEIYSGNQGTALSRTVTVPATGGKIYVTLWSQIKGTSWQSSTYVYTAQVPEKAMLWNWWNGMSLADGNLMLEWSPGVGVSKYSIYVGSTVGGRDIATRNVSAPTTTLSIPVPTDGGPIYITLWSQIGTSWQSESYWAYTALPASGATPSSLYYPNNTSTLNDTAVEFYWDEGVNVTARQLWVGSTPDGYDLFKGGNESGFSRTLNLPGDGRRIYVTLHSKIGSGSTWSSNAYYFTAVTSPPPQAAELWSPSNGATLTGPSLDLNWDAVTGATRYDVYVGNTPMGSDIFKGNMGTGTSKTVIVPSDGRPVYVTLWSQINNKWFQNTYWFTTASLASGNRKAVMIQPENGSELPGTTATFDWDTGTGVSDYSLYVGNTPGGKELYSATSSTIRSRTLTTLPTDGRKIYATLHSKIGTVWQSNSYLYTAANITGVKAEMTSPAPGSTFTSATVTFTWNAGTGTQYWLQVGRTPGSSNIYAGNQGISLTRTLTTMPTDGSPIYVKLQSLINGTWQTNEYIYQAALPP